MTASATERPAAHHPVRSSTGRVLVCLGRFHRAVSATDASRWLAEGIRAHDDGLDVQERLIADGAEGTVDALVGAGYRRVVTRVTGPLGGTVEAGIAVRGELAVIEQAQASGMRLAPARVRSALLASSYGTGELLRAALDLGCRQIVLAVGSSAATDGGAGLLQALGARIIGADGGELPPGGGGILTYATAIDLAGLDPRLRFTTVTVACDGDNPLLGPHGAAAMRRLQRRIDTWEVRALEAALTHYAGLVHATVGEDYSDRPGAGAGGGTGFAALAVLKAAGRVGAQFVLDEVDLERDLLNARLLVVGEGRLDARSLHGKATIRAAALAAEAGVPVCAVAGQIDVTSAQLAEHGIQRAYSLLSLAGSLKAAATDTARLLRHVGTAIAARIDDLRD